MGELTDKLRSFLAERRYAVLATHDPDGSIRLTPIWFLFEDDCFYFASSSRSRKVKNLERNFSASVVVDAREPGRERWASASGSVEILRDGEAESINARIRGRYIAPKALDGPIEAALAASDDVTLKLAPRTWRSWTAPTVESPERLFQPVDAWSRPPGRPYA
jgi:PPOX class probable F420-dependent enzyme